MKSPPASVLLKKALGLPTSKKPGAGSAEPNKKKIGKLSWDQIRAVAKEKMEDMNTNDLEAAARTIAGTARNMGIEVG
jgi:large subunit ribosomal protein L11